MCWKENLKKCTSFEEQKGTRYICSAASRYILVPFEQYGHPRKWAQNNFVTFFLYIFHVKTKIKYSLWILKNKNLFNRHKYPPTNALNMKYFWTLSYKHWWFLSISKLSNPQLQENGMPKKCLDVALICKNVYFGIIIFSCLSFTKPCLRFLLNYFVEEIKVQEFLRKWGWFHNQSSLGNEVDFRDIMNISPNILAKN